MWTHTRLQSAQGRLPLVLRWRQPLSRHLSPSRVLSALQTGFSVFPPELDVLFIALTLYFEVLPSQVGRRVREITLLPALHSLDLGTG